MASWEIILNLTITWPSCLTLTVGSAGNFFLDGFQIVKAPIKSCAGFKLFEFKIFFSPKKFEKAKNLLTVIS